MKIEFAAFCSIWFMSDPLLQSPNFAVRQSLAYCNLVDPVPVSNEFALGEFKQVFECASGKELVL